MAVLVTLLKVLTLLTFSWCVSAEEGSLFVACDVHDMECLSRSAEKFLEKTSKGIPQYDIKALDPLVIPSLNFVLDEELGLTMNFRNVNITGFKDQTITQFVMDLDKKSVILTTKVSLNINADLTITTKTKSNAYEGHFSAKTNTSGTSKYNYELKPDEKGVEKFDVGPETITCEILGDTEITVTPGLPGALNVDDETKQTYVARRPEYRKKTLCKLVEVGYGVAIHNIRAAAKVLPKSHFFKGI